MTQHTLKSKGAAYSPTNLTLIDKDGGTSGIGVGLCSCGTASEVLPSGRARKAWHAEHKAEMERPTVSAEEVEEWQEADADADKTDEEILQESLAEAEELAAKGSETAAHEAESIRGQLDTVTTRVVTVEFEDVSPEAFNVLTGKTVTKVFDWRGNYSIVFAPGSRELAEAYGGLETSQKNVSAVLRQVSVTGDPSQVDAFLGLLEELQSGALAHLKEWQKAHRAGRSGLTDMQKFLQHRVVLAEFITNFTDEVARS